MVKRRKKIVTWLRKKFQLILYHGVNYDILWKVKFNRIKFILLSLLMLCILFTLFYVLIAYTSLRNFIPGYPTEETKILTYENVLRTDSLIRELEQRDIYLGMLRDLIFNEIPIDEDFIVPTNQLTEEEIRNFNNPTKTRKIEQAEETADYRSPSILSRTDNSENSDTNTVPKQPQIFDVFPPTITNSESISTSNTPTPKPVMETIPTFFPPLKGKIVSPYDKSKGHYGTDIASMGETAILATLNGVVLSAEYTVENGYTIIVQHKYDLVSVYKHNKSILVKTGQYVEIGQAIAIYGGTGEFSSGQHLHFELWRKGVSLNPEDFINFE